MIFTESQLTAARECVARLRAGHDRNYAGCPVLDLPESQRLGSGRRENQAYPYFEIAGDGNLVGSYVVFGDQEDPWTDGGDREFATEIAVQLLRAIGAVSPFGNHWTEQSAGDDVDPRRCVHGVPQNVFCERCEA